MRDEAFNKLTVIKTILRVKKSFIWPEVSIFYDKVRRIGKEIIIVRASKNICFFASQFNPVSYFIKGCIELRANNVNHLMIGDKIEDMIIFDHEFPLQMILW